MLSAYDFISTVILPLLAFFTIMPVGMLKTEKIVIVESKR